MFYLAERAAEAGLEIEWNRMESNNLAPLMLFLMLLVDGQWSKDTKYQCFPRSALIFGKSFFLKNFPPFLADFRWDVLDHPGGGGVILDFFLAEHVRMEGLIFKKGLLFMGGGLLFGGF